MVQTTHVARDENHLAIEQNDDFMVFVNPETNEVGYKILNPTSIESDKQIETFSLLSKAKLLALVPTYLTKTSLLSFQKTICEAMAMAIRGDLKGAEEVLEDAKTYIVNRTQETAKIWYVQAIITVLVAIWFPYFILSATMNATGDAAEVDRFFTIKVQILAIGCGALGAGFSLLIRIGTVPVDPSSGRWAHYSETLFRLTVGSLAALIIIFGLQAEVFAGFAKVASQDGQMTQQAYLATFWIHGIFSIAAGASERMVPGLLQQLTNRANDPPTE